MIFDNDYTRLSVAIDVRKNRLDKFLAEALDGVSRSRIQSLVKSGFVLVNNLTTLDAGQPLKMRDEIVVHWQPKIENTELQSDKDVEFSIIYEDDDLMVVYKPAGVVVHPGAGNHSHTLANGLAYHCNLSSNGSRSGIVHRLDKNTSGILVTAKNNFTHDALGGQFQCHSIRRKYICFCYSTINPAEGKIETLISRDRDHRTKMAVSGERGKLAISHYRTLKKFSTFASKVECELFTGRTHQIRVHLSHLGNSLIGDATYSVKNYFVPENIRKYVKNFPRQALHAYFLEFIHPRSGKTMNFTQDMPEDMVALEKILDSA
ncbi:MAG: RluA family pseudouridine synthase [Holosporaceae bacterium]|jgi:23S rRNA pseudouridine1911/1915/1917 synthase|nr:RluA family pseudouridine synthase [Holosporaceae bacterium]